MDRRSWWATVQGVWRVWTRLRWLSTRTHINITPVSPLPCLLSSGSPTDFSHCTPIPPPNKKLTLYFSFFLFRKQLIITWLFFGYSNVPHLLNMYSCLYSHANTFSSSIIKMNGRRNNSRYKTLWFSSNNFMGCWFLHMYSFPRSDCFKLIFPSLSFISM